MTKDRSFISTLPGFLLSFFPSFLLAGQENRVGCGKTNGIMHSGPQKDRQWIGSTVGMERLCTGTGRANGMHTSHA
ncbi:hypothetical protein F5Y08DRAFT_318260 [Xylaria arbuscula]|nr:hypothetical protein F5Y08DRAFT_318260 [Xylaria arbuscula]